MAKDEKVSRSKGLDVRVGYLTTAEQRDWLQAHSTATGLPITVIIRRAVDEYRARVSKRRPQDSITLPPR
jgi:hypothetical protein